MANPILETIYLIGASIVFLVIAGITILQRFAFVFILLWLISYIVKWIRGK